VFLFISIYLSVSFVVYFYPSLTFSCLFLSVVLFISVELVIPAGCLGDVYQPSDRPSTNIVRWAHLYDAWAVFVAEVNGLLAQISCGASMVHADTVVRATLICRLMSAILESDAQFLRDNVCQIEPLTTRYVSIHHHHYSWAESP